LVTKFGRETSCGTCAFRAGLTPWYDYTPLSLALRPVRDPVGRARISGGLRTQETRGKMDACEN